MRLVIDDAQVGGSGRPRRPTMEDVALRAGVSRPLVSIVFRDQPGASEETRARVRAAAAEIGYRPDTRAQLLSRKQTRLIGVSFGVGHEFHADLVTELYAAAQDSGYELVLSGVTPNRREQRAAQDLLAFRCDAVILLGPGSRLADLAAIGRQTPTIVVARAATAEVIDVVRTDDVTGAELATRHLLELGHSRILHIDGGRAPGAAERRRGYHAAMRAAGLGRLASVIPGGLTEAEGSRAAASLIDRRMRPEPIEGRASTRSARKGDGDSATAAVVFNDQSAIGFLATVRAAGINVPQQLSIVGYDDSRLARASWAQLTTIAQDSVAIARAAVQRALARIAGEPAGKPVLIKPTLIERATTAPPTTAPGRPGGSALSV
jgi:DNA-binding LacI/PurR family transcriptional regulator